MTLKQMLTILSLGAVLSLIVGACTPGAANEAIIATSVASTVQAQKALDAPATATSLAMAALEGSTTPESESSPTPAATEAPPTAPLPGGTSSLCTGKATFDHETIPDGTIVSPGAVFTKIWYIKNDGTCPWNSSWKWVYSSGELMGGATVYNFPGYAAPDQVVAVPVIFTAPLVGGEYRGYWKIQSPWGAQLGDSGSGNAFWVDVVVGSGTPENSQTQTVYDVTNVVMHMSRRCTTANTFWHIWADMSSNGPVKVIFDWIQSDGNANRNIAVSFGSATTITVDDGEWSQRWTSSPNPRWVKIVTTSPTYHEWPQSDLLYLCPGP